jgi:mannose-6-phosphate isomerase
VSSIPPLRFEPLFRRYLWGGRRLGTKLGKPIGRENCAESWEIVDHGDDQSVVLAGPWRGKTLHQLVNEHGRELLGRHAPLPQFPLLFKFLDAQRTLSVQVHPNDEQAARLDPPDRGKTEAWVVLDAEPGSLVYAGLKEGVDRAALEAAIAEGTSEACLHRFEPRVGDCIFLPAGTVHALGAGLMVAEIQQASDTTYRLYDWNRTDAQGRSRELHIEAGLNVVNFDYGADQPQQPQSTDQAGVERLVACDKFVLDRRRFDRPQPLGGDDRFHLLAVIQGSVRLANDPTGEPLNLGQTALLPAAAEVELRPEAPTVLLDMYLP